MNETTLCYIEKNSSYLMLYRNKKELDPNKGKWIGVGGHLEENESADECLKREVFEETGLTLTAYRLRGIIYFESDTYENEKMYLYTASSFDGQLTSCNEGTLKWIPKIEIMSLNLWEGDKIFLQYLLEDKGYFELKLTYKGDNLVESELINNG